MDSLTLFIRFRNRKMTDETEAVSFVDLKEKPTAEESRSDMQVLTFHDDSETGDEQTDRPTCSSTYLTAVAELISKPACVECVTQDFDDHGPGLSRKEAASVTLGVSVEQEADGEKACSLPFFQQLYEDDIGADTNDYLDVGAASQVCTNFPDVEELQTSLDDLMDKSVVDLLKEVRLEIASFDDEKHTEDRTAETCERLDSRPCVNAKTASRATKKRKKQQKKLQKLAAQQTPRTRTSRFVQSYEELKRSRVPLDLDKDIDPLLLCPVCLEMYHLPSTCHPCGHIFCDLCLRRLTAQGSEGVPCPLCRTVISSCELDREFDERLILMHPDIYTARAVSERRTKFRHFPLPYTPPVPLGKRILRQIAANRNSQSETMWMSHDWFKFLMGCTAGMCLSLLIMLLNHVKSFHDVRDVNIAFLSILVGASVTYVTFKYMKI